MLLELQTGVSGEKKGDLQPSFVNSSVAQLIELQQNEIYIGALNRASALVLKNLEQVDFGEFPLPKILSWETIIQYFFTVLFRNLESLDLSEIEFEKLREYLEVKNGKKFEDTIVLERILQGITLGVMDTFACLLAAQNFHIDIKVIQKLIYLNLQSGSANPEKVFTTVIQQTVEEFGRNVDADTLISRLEEVNTANFETFSKSSLSACPFFKSGYKKEWLQAVFDILERIYLPEFRKQQNSNKNSVHDFYTENI